MRNLGALLGTGLLFVFALGAADPTGIWTGQVSGKNGEKQDIAFQFQTVRGATTGVMFGDEFDLPVQDVKIEAGRITFSVTNINYSDQRRLKTVYSGVLADQTMELTREQVGAEPGSKPKEPPTVVLLKRLL